MTLEENLNEAQYIRRGDEYPDRTNLPEPSGYYRISCNQQEVRNNGRPDAYHFVSDLIWQ